MEQLQKQVDTQAAAEREQNQNISLGNADNVG